MEQNHSQPDPSKIMQIGMGFWASKALLVAVKLKIFTLLAGGKKKRGEEIKSELQLRATTRHVLDWLDALVTLGILQREGVWEDALYYNSPESEIFLDRQKPSYIGGILEMANNRLYRFWGDLEAGLITGSSQNETKGNLAEDGFSELYKAPGSLQEFMDAMSGIQTGNFIALAKKFDFSKYKTVADIGGADGWLSIQLCTHYPHLTSTTFDLPEVGPVAEKKIAQFNLSDRIKFVGGDFLNDVFPSAEVITMGNILHGLNEEAKQVLVSKVYATLPERGIFITIENIIDDTRNQNLFGMLMSLNMLIENGDAFDYMPADFNRWTKAAGFTKTEFIPLAGPASAAVAYK